MTTEELDKTRKERSSHKFKSRTFWMVVAWMMLIPAGFVAQMLISDFAVPIDNIVTLAGSVTLLYIGGNKGQNIAETLKLDK